MEHRELFQMWVMRIVAISFSMFLIILFAIASTPLNAMSSILLWSLIILLWLMYSGHEARVIGNVIQIFFFNVINKRKLEQKVEHTAIIEAYAYMYNKMTNIWDGHIIMFLIYTALVTMLFGIITISIYHILTIAGIVYILHILFRCLTMGILKYS